MFFHRPVLLFASARPEPAVPFQPHPSVWTLAPALVLGLLALALLPGDANRELFLAANHAAAGWLPSDIWAAVTLCGSTLGTIALLAPSLKTQPRWLVSILLAAPLAVLFSQGGKRLFEIPRPASVLPSEQFHVIGEWLYFGSFPSGHATTAFLAASVVVLGWPNPATRLRIALTALPLAGLVAFSRIAAGAHWPLDVAVGGMGGWLIGALGVTLSARWTFWQSETAVRAMAALALGAGLALMFLDLGYPEARIFRLGLASWGMGGALAVFMKGKERRR